MEAKMRGYYGVMVCGIILICIVASTISPLSHAERKNDEVIYRGVRLNMATNYFLMIRQPIIFLMWMDFVSMGYLQSINANTISILLSYVVDDNGEISPFPFSQSLAEYHIKRFHETGLMVSLTPIFIGRSFIFGPLPEKILQKENFWENLRIRTLEAAEFAEENDVEIFFSSNELELVIGWERALNFSRDILPDVRERFSGKVGWHGWLRGLVDMGAFNANGTVMLSVPITRFNFTGYDMYGMTTDVGADIKNSMESFARGFIAIGMKISMQSNTSFLLPEIFGMTKNAESLTHFYFEEGEGKVVGYFPTYTIWQKSFFDDYVKDFYTGI